MTAITHLLKDFNAPPAPEPAAPDPAEEEAARRAAESYEEGYRAGLEEAARAQAEDTARISAELSRNLQDLSFTYHEAHARMIAGLRPLFAALTGRVLPRMAEDSLVPLLAEKLTDIARDHGTPEVTIGTAPETRTAVEALLDRDYGFPVTVRADPELSPGQADLRFGGEELRVDLDALLAGLTEAVEGFFDANDKDLSHV